jgi:hypothetical protein
MKDMSKIKGVISTITVARAREVMANAFAGDPSFRDVYVANIAMLLHDRYGITDYEKRNAAGNDIVKLIFES